MGDTLERVRTIAERGPAGSSESGSAGDRYKWIALSNTTLSMTMATIEESIVIIAMPAIFRGIHLNPRAPGTISYLLWMIMGYLLVQAVLVVTLGRLGDMFGRVRIYNLGFVVFTLTSIALSLDPLTGGGGALWLIGWRVGQAVGGGVVVSPSAAGPPHAVPAKHRGRAPGANQIAGISRQFVGPLLSGRVAAGDGASVRGAIARGGLQFRLVIWLAGIWLPLHGYDYVDTPLWAGIYLLPLTAGFLIAGPISGALSDRYGQRPFATAGLLVAAGRLPRPLLPPVGFPPS